MLSTVVLLLSVCMLLESCFGRIAIPDQSREGRTVKINESYVAVRRF